MDCSPLGSSVHGILQQEYWSELPWPTSRVSSWLRDRTHDLASLTSQALAGEFCTVLLKRRSQNAEKPRFATKRTERVYLQGNQQSRVRISLKLISLKVRYSGNLQVKSIAWLELWRKVKCFFMDTCLENGGMNMIWGYSFGLKWQKVIFQTSKSILHNSS